MEIKPTMCRLVIYSHIEGTIPQLIKSPAIVQRVYNNSEDGATVVDLVVFRNTDEVLFIKGATQGEKDGQWSWPPRVMGQ